MAATHLSLRSLAFATIACLVVACQKDPGPVETSPFIDVVITPPTPVVEVGGQITLTARVTGPAGISQGVVWSSIDPSIVAVTNTGVVTALADGSGRIRAAWAQDIEIYRQVEVLVTLAPVEEDAGPVRGARSESERED
jgi:hypothetical protein